MLVKFRKGVLFFFLLLKISKVMGRICFEKRDSFFNNIFKIDEENRMYPRISKLRTAVRRWERSKFVVILN